MATERVALAEGVSSTAVDTGMTKLVVAGTLLLVGKDFVGLGDFFKLFLGLFVARIFIRMVFNRKLAVSLFDFVVRGVFTNA